MKCKDPTHARGPIMGGGGPYITNYIQHVVGCKEICFFFFFFFFFFFRKLSNGSRKSETAHPFLAQADLC